MNAIVLDTETTNSLDCPFVYDLGWAVIDLDTHEVKATRSFAIAEIFLNRELMESAYFAEKIPSYWDEIHAGTRKLVKWRTARTALLEDCADYQVGEIYAHNARFDYLSCQLTQRYLTKSRWRWFFPYGVKMCDTLKMARKAFGADESYTEFCTENEYKTARGQMRFTAEVLYRFLTQDVTFEEEHKGLDDVLIEKEILLECRRRGVHEGSLWTE